MPFFNIVAATNENTVVTEYEPVKARTDSYQREADLCWRSFAKQIHPVLSYALSMPLMKSLDQKRLTGFFL